MLCGGSGTRMEDYSLPKPLNMIYGRPSIWYVLKNAPVDSFHFVVAQHLKKYNFEQIVRNEFKSKVCTFTYLPYFTRGPIESAFLGTRDISETSENVVFLDNDVLYNFPDHMFTEKDSAFLGYAHDSTASESYSFMTLDSKSRVTAFKEKQRISNLFCCGVYGFKTITQFRDVALSIMTENDKYSELYMSIAFQKFIEDNEPVNGIQFEGKIQHIGSLNELKSSWEVIPKQNMRVCFDLDNTLVTYPQVPGDYTSVLPIPTMIELARRLKSEGHTIIIYTARRMKTHSHNVGAVCKDIAKITFETLDLMDIPYDEIIFGKPYADIYIDDRAVNPYSQDVSLMGYISPKNAIPPMNGLKPNKHNTISVEGDIVVKKGPSVFLRGEAYYYQTIPKESNISKYFAKFTDYIEGRLRIEQISGVPLYTLYRNGLMTSKHVESLFDFIDVLHHKTAPIHITAENVRNNYIEKLRNRFKNDEDYPFEDASAVQERCLRELELYLSRDHLEIAPFIHGDLWFSNIIEEFKTGSIKVLDMKGSVDNILTTNGDPLYDYGKLYQSFLGYDIVLNNESMPRNSEELLTEFTTHLKVRNIQLKTLKSITFSLVMGTFHFIDSIDTKNRIWKWLKDTF